VNRMMWKEKFDPMFHKLLENSEPHELTFRSCDLATIVFPSSVGKGEVGQKEHCVNWRLAMLYMQFFLRRVGHGIHL
jgi:hypothetical protein